MRFCFVGLLVLALSACRTPPLDYDGGAPPGSDLAGTDLRFGGTDLAQPRDLSGSPISCCGVPGNPGNEKGVGKFCASSLDCTGRPANICSSTFSMQLHFCTKACQKTVPNDCGSGATCQCAGTNCICAPGECVTPPPGC
ncbi:MAG: hypothetical protein JWN44_3328 [Myxococcales bacterium]|nr:hypothetical protein [Myxococcales bacterium]